jgi:caffeoyl-CoA O-methyltransferase
MWQKKLVLDGIEQYAEACTSPTPALLEELERETLASAGQRAIMLSGRVVGRFLKLLATVLRPKLAVDVGTFTGYSALSIAEGLPAEGKVVTCEVDATQAAFAQRYFDRSPHRERIDLRVGPALASIQAITEPIGLAFVDAEKTEYWDYVDTIVPKLTSNGVIVVDNTLFFGTVLSTDDEAKTAPEFVQRNRVALLEFNRRVRADSRIECALLSVRDGLTVIARRGGT